MDDIDLQPNASCPAAASQTSHPPGQPRGVAAFLRDLNMPFDPQRPGVSPALFYLAGGIALTHLFAGAVGYLIRWTIAG